MSEKVTTAAAAAESIKFKKPSQLKEIWRRFRKNPGSMIGLVMLCLIAFFLIFANLFASYDSAVTQNLSQKLATPSAEHIFGLDSYGRDLLARVLYGGRTSIAIAVLATLSSCVVGCALGAIAGYFGGKVDSIIMRGLDIFMSVPDILFTMAVVFALGANTVNLVIALTLAYFTNYVRLVRSQILSLSDLEYVEAAKAGGASSARIILTHIFPNAMGVIIVNTTLNVAKIILYESTLGFLGLGMPPPAPEWGQIISDAREYMRVAPHMLVFPALAIVITACSVNLVGDGLRDAMDPHLKS